MVLRVAHGEIYTKVKLHRFGLIDSPNCPRCTEDDTLIHKFFACPYTRQIWSQTIRLTNKLRINPIDLNTLDYEDPSVFLATNIDDNQGTLTVHSEILKRILSLKDDQDHLIRPKVMVNLAVKHLIKREKDGALKEQLKTLLGN